MHRIRTRANEDCETLGSHGECDLDLMDFEITNRTDRD